MIDCGGCQGLGNHARICPEDKGHRAAMYNRTSYALKNLGDSVGGNDPGLSNTLWAISAECKKKAKGATVQWLELNGLRGSK